MGFPGCKASRGPNPSLLATGAARPPKLRGGACWPFSSRFQPAARSRHRQVSR